MPSPELGRQLADLGGLALFLLVVVVAAVGLYRRWWVPGWVYDLERKGREVAETQAERNAAALEQQARAYETLAGAVTGERARRDPRRSFGSPDAP